MAQQHDEAGRRSGKLGPWASPQTRAHAASVLAPLDPEEGALAVREALAAVMRDGNVVGDRTTVYEPRLRIEKPPQRDGAPRRLVWVRVRDRDRRVVHEVSVEAGSIVEHTVNERASPPFSDAEREEARRLMFADHALGRLLAGGDVQIEWFNPGHGPERLLGARFTRITDRREVEPITQAVVDLDEGTLVRGGDRSG